MDYFSLFPIQTFEGHEFVSKHYFHPENWSSKEFEYFVTSLLLREPLDISEENLLAQFRWYLGDAYDPRRKFPFLIGDETEYRIFNPEPIGLFRDLYLSLIRWFGNPTNDNSSVAPYLLDYLFSLFHCLPPEGLDRHIPAESTDRDLHNSEVVGVRKQVRDLMHLAYMFVKASHYYSVTDKKFKTSIDIFNRFESLAETSVPKQLIEHWKWVKRRSLIYKFKFDANEEYLDSTHDAIFYLEKGESVDFVFSILENLKYIDLLSIKNILLRITFDRDYFIERSEYCSDKTGTELLVSFVDERAVKEFASLLSSCGFNNLTAEQVSGE